MAVRFPQWFISLASCLMLSFLSISVAAADDKPGGGKGDQKLFDALTDLINQGADLYNIGGDQSGCYYLFKGALTMLRVELNDRPELQKAIDEGIAKADKQRLLRSRAFTLRNVLGDIRDKVNPNPKKVEIPQGAEVKEKLKIPFPGKPGDKKKQDVKKTDEKKKDEKKKDDQKPDDQKPDDKKNEEPKSDS